MFEEHTMIRRAAIQCWTNLCTSPLMAKRCEAPNDLGKTISRNFSFLRKVNYNLFFFSVKYTVLLIADDEDPEICKAAAGALAMLTGQSDKCCKKVFEVCKHWKNILSSFQYFQICFDLTDFLRISYFSEYPMGSMFTQRMCQ